jgi:hypothetical protein
MLDERLNRERFVFAEEVEERGFAIVHSLALDGRELLSE